MESEIINKENLIKDEDTLKDEILITEEDNYNEVEKDNKKISIPAWDLTPPFDSLDRSKLE